MRHPMMQAILAAVIAVFAGFGTASAQGVGVELYAGDPYYYYSDRYVRYDRTPRVYGYYYRSEPPPSVVVPAPNRPDSCGVYRYWNGERCADARINPPVLN